LFRRSPRPFQQVFGGVNENEAAPVHGLKQIDFITFIAKHPGNGVSLQHVIDAVEDLLPRIVKGFVEKLPKMTPCFAVRSAPKIAPNIYS
jgi:hypothetical protein